MVAQPQVLALIPARGGSKGIPGKNIKSFAGYPLIAYSIAAGLQAKTVQRVIVSTDDENIAVTARQYGAETPFLRPAEFARDSSLDLPVFEHALRWLAEHENYFPEIIIQLRPTSPFRPQGLIDQAVELLLKNPDADCVRGVVPAGQNPHKMWRIDQTSGRMQPLLEVEGIAEPYNAPRQILPPVYWQTGHIDAVRSRTVLEKHSMTGDCILPVMLDSSYTVDIDTPGDWKKYEHLAYSGELDFVHPGKKPRPLPEKIDLLILDFDGVITDNRVFVNEDGKEMVAAYRSDSYGIHGLKKAGIEVMVLSSEVNPVVSARCKKMGVAVLQGIEEKASVLQKYLQEHRISPEHVVYLGNDINDIPCFEIVGCAVVVADAQPQALRAADRVLGRKGGYGAVREICDMILAVLSERSLNG